MEAASSSVPPLEQTASSESSKRRERKRRWFRAAVREARTKDENEPPCREQQETGEGAEGRVERPERKEDEQGSSLNRAMRFPPRAGTLGKNNEEPKKAKAGNEEPRFFTADGSDSIAYEEKRGPRRGRIPCVRRLAKEDDARYRPEGVLLPLVLRVKGRSEELATHLTPATIDNQMTEVIIEEDGRLSVLRDGPGVLLLASKQGSLGRQRSSKRRERNLLVLVPVIAQRLDSGRTRCMLLGPLGVHCALGTGQKDACLLHTLLEVEDGGLKVDYLAGLLATSAEEIDGREDLGSFLRNNLSWYTELLGRQKYLSSEQRPFEQESGRRNRPRRTLVSVLLAAFFRGEDATSRMKGLTKSQLEDDLAKIAAERKTRNDEVGAETGRAEREPDYKSCFYEDDPQRAYIEFLRNCLSQEVSHSCNLLEAIREKRVIGGMDFRKNCEDTALREYLASLGFEFNSCSACRQLWKSREPRGGEDQLAALKAPKLLSFLDKPIHQGGGAKEKEGSLLSREGQRQRCIGVYAQTGMEDEVVIAVKGLEGVDLREVAEAILAGSPGSWGADKELLEELLVAAKLYGIDSLEMTGKRIRFSCGKKAPVVVLRRGSSVRQTTYVDIHLSALVAREREAGETEEARIEARIDYERMKSFVEGCQRELNQDLLNSGALEACTKTCRTSANSEELLASFTSRREEETARIEKGRTRSKEAIG